MTATTDFPQSSPTPSPSWAKLRQVILTTNDIETDTAALRSGLSLGIGFHDSELAEHAMADHTFTLADFSYLQLITSLAPQDPLSQWTERIGGRGGYALSIQHPDPACVRARAEARGVGVIRAQSALGYPIVQLHPRDTAILLEADGIADPDVWFWDDLGPDAQPHADAAVTGIVSVEAGVADPHAMGRLWHELLDLTPGTDPSVVNLGGPELRFVAGISAHWTITLRLRPGCDAPPADVLPGLTLRYVAASG